MQNYHSILLVIITVLLTSCGTSKSFRNEVDQYREAYKKDFLDTEASPLDADDLVLLDFYNPDAKWKLTCNCILEDNAMPIDMPTYSGRTKKFKAYATAFCQYKNQKFSLKLYQNLALANQQEYAEHLFLPFKDLTNSDETYGGGRYMDYTIKDIKKNQIIIDFNRCYNPWCAYSNGYNCPVPPRDNHLNLSVKAGEKTFKGKFKEVRR